MHRADNFTTFICRLSWNLGTSTSRKPEGLSSPEKIITLPLMYFSQLTLLLLVPILWIHQRGWMLCLKVSASVSGYAVVQLFNPLAPELDIYSLAHHLCKIWIFYELRRVTLGNTRHIVEEWTKMMTESPKKKIKYICWLNI